MKVAIEGKKALSGSQFQHFPARIQIAGSCGNFEPGLKKIVVHFGLSITIGRIKIHQPRSPVMLFALELTGAKLVPLIFRRFVKQKRVVDV